VLQREEKLGFFEKYLINISSQINKKSINKGVILFLVICYMIINIILIIPENIFMKGIFMEIQALIAIFLTIGNIRNGHKIAIWLILSTCIETVCAFFIRQNIIAVSGFIITLGTMIICELIYIYCYQLQSRLKEINFQNKKLNSLYEEISVTEEELREQNEKLLLYNLTMEENEKQLNQLAFYDLLTDLPNRKMIHNHLEQFIVNSGETDLTFSVILIDLDNFKIINDTMGHQMGDLLLKQITFKIKSYINEEDMLGRLGGDEFALIVQRKIQEPELLSYVEGLRNLLLEPVTIEKIEVNTSASFGISVYPKDGESADDLLKFSDIAMYHAKYLGKNTIQIFNKVMNDKILQKLEFDKLLTNALSNNELYMVYQPQYELEGRTLRGFESLIRWKSPKLGAINPLKFITAAEESGQIIIIGEWVIKTACETLKKLHDKYKITPIMSINISAVQVMDVSFVEMVKKIILETGINPVYLEFEITESVFISSMQYVVEVLNKIKEIGIHIALDDFGTGYSSLNYLQMLPIDTLKIDKSFIDKIDNEDNKQIVGSIISLMHQLGLSVIAEGVEEQSQLDYLKAHQCDIIQGYIWGKPMHYDQVEYLMDKNVLLEENNGMAVS